MPNSIEVQKILSLQNALQQMWSGAFGTLYNHTKYLVKDDDQARRNTTQADVNASVQGLLIISVFSVWEEHVYRAIEQDWLERTELVRLRAYRHVRHSTAHTVIGARADGCKAEFDEVMNSKDPFPQLRWTNDTLDISAGRISYDCLQYMQGLSQQLVMRLASDQRPTNSMP